MNRAYNETLSLSHRLSLDQSMNYGDHHNDFAANNISLIKSHMATKKFEFKAFIDKTISSLPYKYELELHNPLSSLESLSGTNTWTNREISWLQANSKFLFGVSTKLEQNKWVCIINWIVKYIK